MRKNITQEELKRLLHYNKDTGIFTWKVSNTNIVKIGDVAGTLMKGYVPIQINKEKYMAHRLAWMYVYGEFPKDQLDHINHDRKDNRIVNLRSVTHAENGRNLLLRNINKSGVAGVHWEKRVEKWKACIKFDGKAKHLGYFDDLNDAKKVREEAKIKYGFYPNHA